MAARDARCAARHVSEDAVKRHAVPPRCRVCRVAAQYAGFELQPLQVGFDARQPRGIVVQRGKCYISDALFLPAPPVNQTFNVISAATLKYRGEARTILRDESTALPPPYVLEKP